MPRSLSRRAIKELEGHLAEWQELRLLAEGKIEAISAVLAPSNHALPVDGTEPVSPPASRPPKTVNARRSTSRRSRTTSPYAGLRDKVRGYFVAHPDADARQLIDAMRPLFVEGRTPLTTKIYTELNRMVRSGQLRKSKNGGFSLAAEVGRAAS
jgi:hypothetical protein